MSLTLKNMLDSVLLESGVATETAYAASDDDEVRRLLYLANRSIETLSRYPWQALRKSYEFSLTTETTYALPADFRSFIPDTMFTDSHLWPVDFPADAGEWAYLQASDGGGGIAVKMRLLGNLIEVYQPTSGETVRFEYVSKYPVKASDNTAKERFSADTDVCLLDDDLVTRDILWRYKKLMGHADWQADMLDAKLHERILKGQEAGSRTISPCDSGEATGPYYDLWRPVPNT